MFISGISHLIFLDLSLPQVTETTENRIVDKECLLYFRQAGTLFPRIPFSTELQVGGRAYETLHMRFGIEMWSSSHILCMLWRSVGAPGAVTDHTHCCCNMAQLLTSFMLSSNLSHTQGWWCIFSSIKNGSRFSYRSLPLSMLDAGKWWKRQMGSSGFLWDSPQP